MLVTLIKRNEKEREERKINEEEKQVKGKINIRRKIREG